MSEELHEHEEHSDLDRMRHSTAHVMAEAVMMMFSGAKFAIGPSIENGFYYDFDLLRPLTPEDLGQIENNMRRIIKGKHKFIREEISRAEALKRFAAQPYKVELINDLPEDEVISIYTHSTFTDLCRGPHVEDTGKIPRQAFKLLSVAGAYWRGDEHRPMLQRIYGTAWNTKEELQEYLQKLEELERRDHRKLNNQLDLYSTHEEAGAGLIYWHPKGGFIRSTVEDFWKQEHFANGYDILYSPHIGKAWLWETSGHLDFYRENMYAPLKIDEQEFYLKPMNCPFHILMYKSKKRSYRDLPLRWAELGTVYRYERSGVLHGLLRVRGFTQDDAHIFCTPEQIEDEVLEVLRFSLHIWRSFGFHDIKAYIATRPEKYAGELERWEQATAALKRAAGREGVPYEMDEGGGVFYGPKIDLKIKDAMGREWQMTTIQFDFNLSERFDMTYIAEDGTAQRPYMVHRALLGSLERFFGLLIEHYGGAFPVWLMPVQVQIIPVTDHQYDYAKEIEQKLRAAGLRAKISSGRGRMQAKIRAAQLQKIPYMLIVGNREVESGTVSVRLRTEKDLGAKPLEEFIAMAQEAVREKREL